MFKSLWNIFRVANTRWVDTGAGTAGLLQRFLAVRITGASVQPKPIF